MIIKNEKYNEIRHDLQALAETLIKQCVLVENLLMEGWKESSYKQFIENESRINPMEESLLQKLTATVIQFSPKGKDLRKIVYCHEVIIYMEGIGSYLFNIVSIIKEADIQSSDYNTYKTALATFFEKTEETIQKACYSFYREDVDLAYRIIPTEQYEEIKELKTNTLNTLLTDFEEIPLQRQELVNILVFDKTFFFMEKMIDNAIDIAKSTIFAIQGNIENQ